MCGYGPCPCFRFCPFFCVEGKEHPSATFQVACLGVDGRKYLVFGKSVVPAFENDFGIDCLVELRERVLPNVVMNVATDEVREPRCKHQMFLEVKAVDAR